MISNNILKFLILCLIINLSKNQINNIENKLYYDNNYFNIINDMNKNKLEKFQNKTELIYFNRNYSISNLNHSFDLITDKLNNASSLISDHLSLVQETKAKLEEIYHNLTLISETTRNYTQMNNLIEEYTKLVKEYNEKTGGICAELPNNKIMYLYRHAGICNYWIWKGRKAAHIAVKTLYKLYFFKDIKQLYKMLYCNYRFKRPRKISKLHKIRKCYRKGFIFQIKITFTNLINHKKYHFRNKYISKKKIIHKINYDISRITHNSGHSLQKIKHYKSNKYY